MGSVRTKGKRIAVVTGAGAAIVVAMAAIVLYRPILERWYIHKLEFGDEKEAKTAAERLGAMRSMKARELFVERWIDLYPGEVPILLPLDLPARPAPSGSRLTDGDKFWASQERLLKYMGVDRGDALEARLGLEILQCGMAGIRVRVYTAEVFLEEIRSKGFEGLAPFHRAIIEEARPLAIGACLEALGSEDLAARAWGIHGISLAGKEGAGAIPILEGIGKDDPLHGHARAALVRLRGAIEDRKADAAYREKEEPGVLEAAFRRALTDRPNPRSDIYALSYESEPGGARRAPSEDLLRRLDGIVSTDDRKTVIRVVAWQKLGPPRPGGPSAAQEGPPDCTVTIVEWIGRHEVEFRVSIYGGPLAGSGFTARAIRTDAGWAVIPGSIRDRIIS